MLQGPVERDVLSECTRHAEGVHLSILLRAFARTVCEGGYRFPAQCGPVPSHGISKPAKYKIFQLRSNVQCSSVRRLSIILREGVLF